MKTISLLQGSADWHAHRAEHFNASDAPAMLGISPYKTRAELLRERATGVSPEIDAATQRRFDDGHRYEELARPLAEQIIGEDLFPVTGTEGKFSASFDGLTLLEDTAFEHKSLNDELRCAMVEGCTGADLPLLYQVQMEHQAMVSKAGRVLFMASKWKRDAEAGEWKLDEERHCWYYPDHDLRSRIVAGWEQFEHDLSSYQPEQPSVPAPIGRSPETLPALAVQVQGMVLASNLEPFREHAMALLSGINRDLQTDEDFANAESTVKWCKTVEDKLDLTKSSVLAQMADVDAVCRTIDDIAAETRRVRLELDRLVKAEKESRKAEIVRAGVDAVRAHYAGINATLGEHAILFGQLDTGIGASIKGLRTLSSITDAVDTAVANAKIAASQRAERVRASIAALAEASVGHETLFADRVALCATKAPDDIRNLVSARIAEHQRREAEKEAERIRCAESAQQKESSMPPTAAKPCDPNAGETTPIRPDANGSADGLPAVGGSQLKLGARIKPRDINARIAPLSITADGLAQLGFRSVGTERAAKLYVESDWPAICNALIALVTRAANERSAA